MTNYQALAAIYTQLDTVYLALIIIAFWVAATGHLLDWATQRHAHALVTIFWGLVVCGYVAGMLFIGLVIS
jgi:hypothetical protein